MKFESIRIGSIFSEPRGRGAIERGKSKDNLDVKNHACVNSLRRIRPAERPLEREFRLEMNTPALGN